MRVYIDHPSPVKYCIQMKPIIIDVREPDEYQKSHVEGAINLPLSILQSDPDATHDLPKDGTYIVYCELGKRAKRAALKLKKMGYTNVTNGINQEKVESLLGAPNISDL